MNWELTAESVLREENIRLQRQILYMRKLFDLYMDPEVAKILLEKQQIPLERAGKEYELTVMFADIRNFTYLVQHLTPLESWAFLTEYFDMVADVVASWRGILDKFIGDGALVVFGGPVSLESPSLTAVSAAIEIQKRFEELLGRWALMSDIFLQIGLGVGISRGVMCFGNVGSGRRLDYTVVGAAVNIAQRLASDTVSGQILVTETVYGDIAGKVPAREEKIRVLRGLEQTFRLYSILT
jgi:adenylate cyclase